MKNISTVEHDKFRHFEIINNFYSSLIGTNNYLTVADLAVSALMHYSGSPSVAIFELDKKNKLLYRISVKGFATSVKKSSNVFQLNNSITGQAIKKRKIIFIKDIASAKVIDIPARNALLEAGFNTVISIPLLYGNETIGAANLIFHDKDIISKIDVDALTAIAKTIAMAIVNAKYVKGIEEEIQKRNETEKELYLSQNKYKELVENINDLVVKFNTSGKLQYVSPNYCAMFGIKPENVLGKKYLPRIHPDDIYSVQEILRKALKKPYYCEHEERMMTINGWRWIQWSNKAVANSSSKPEEIIAIGRDITDRKETELALIKSGNNINTIIKTIPDLLVRLNKNGVYLDFITIPDSIRQISKKHKYDIGISQTLPPNVYKTAKLKIKKVLLSGKTELMEYSMPYESTIRHFEARIVKSGSDEVLVIVRDITTIKKYREEISKLALIARETENGVIITDHQNYIEWVNDGFTRITGYSLDEVVGKRPGDFLMGEESDVNLANKVQNVLEHGETIRVEILNYDKNKNKFWVELNCQPVFDNAGKVSKYIYMQIVTTERKEYELKLKEQQNKLTELTRHLIAMREAERADIARGIHDELGQVVAAVKMNLTFLINSLLDTGTANPPGDIIAELKSMSKMIDNSVYSIRRLIKNLRPETLDKLGLVAAVKQQLEDFKQLTKINYRLTKNFDDLDLDNNIAITAYRTIQESLTNIIKHSHAERVSISLKLLDNTLHLKINDNGSGIKSEDLNKSQSFGIFGMRQRIEGLGGSFTITGKPGIGTTLSIKFPIF